MDAFVDGSSLDTFVDGLSLGSFVDGSSLELGSPSSGCADQVQNHLPQLLAELAEVYPFSFPL